LLNNLPTILVSTVHVNYNDDGIVWLLVFQSFGYPSLRPQPEGTKTLKVPEGPYGVPNVMLHG